MSRNSSTAKPTRTAFRDGVLAGAPLLVGIVPFGLIFGVTAAGSAVGAGLGFATSIIIFGGAAQLAVVQLIDGDAAIATVVITGLVVNSRHVMYSAAMTPYFSEFPSRSRFVLPYLLTDQAFAVSITRYQEVEDPTYRRWFYTGAAMALWVAWQITTGAGVLIGGTTPGALVTRFCDPSGFPCPHGSGGPYSPSTRRRTRRWSRCGVGSRRPVPTVDDDRSRLRRGGRYNGGKAAAMSAWLIVVAVGAGTYLSRLSFIGAFGSRRLPPVAERALAYVAPAIFAALVLPAVLLRDASVDRRSSHESALVGGHSGCVGRLAIRERGGGLRRGHGRSVDPGLRHLRAQIKPPPTPSEG